MCVCCHALITAAVVTVVVVVVAVQHSNATCLNNFVTKLPSGWFPKVLWSDTSSRLWYCGQSCFLWWYSSTFRQHLRPEDSSNWLQLLWTVSVPLLCCKICFVYACINISNTTSSSNCRITNRLITAAVINTPTTSYQPSYDWTPKPPS